MKTIKVLVACEESQIICNAFRVYGYESYSCDIQEPSGGHFEWHILGDALKIINGGRIVTMDGCPHVISNWDLIIAHPPCTFLSTVGNRYFNVERYGDKAKDRLKEREKAAIFFMNFVNANCEHIAIENPIGYMSRYYRKPDQIIHPYMFSYGENDKANFVTKATCLWLKNLPVLQPTYIGDKPDNAKLFGKKPNGNNYSWTDKAHTKNRQKNRSKTFSGIANAIVKQWGCYIEK